MLILSFEAAPEEVRRIRAAAKATHFSLAEYLRHAALPAALMLGRQPEKPPAGRAPSPGGSGCARA